MSYQSDKAKKATASKVTKTAHFPPHSILYSA